MAAEQSKLVKVLIWTCTWKTLAENFRKSEETNL